MVTVYRSLRTGPRTGALLAMLVWASILVAQTVELPPVRTPITPPAHVPLAPPATLPSRLPLSAIPSGPRMTAAPSAARLQPAAAAAAPAAPAAATSVDIAPPPGPGPFWRSTAIPAACVVAGVIRSTTGCDVVDAASFGWSLAGTASSRERLRLLAEKATTKTVFFVLPRQMQMGAKVNLVRKAYAAEQRQFDELFSQIQTAMFNEQQAAQLRTQFALQDSADVVTLKEAVHQENRDSVNAAAGYIENHPRSHGVQFECKLACRQAVAAGRGISVFD